MLDGCFCICCSAFLVSVQMPLTNTAFVTQYLNREPHKMCQTGSSPLPSCTHGEALWYFFIGKVCLNFRERQISFCVLREWRASGPWRDTNQSVPCFRLLRILCHLSITLYNSYVRLFMNLWLDEKFFIMMSHDEWQYVRNSPLHPVVLLKYQMFITTIDKELSDTAYLQVLEMGGGLRHGFRCWCTEWSFFQC